MTGTRRDADRELSRLLVEADEGRFVATAAMTLDVLLDRWLDVKRQTVEPSTLKSYEWIARTYIRPALGDRKVGALRPIDLDMLYSDLAGRGLSDRDPLQRGERGGERSLVDAGDHVVTERRHLGLEGLQPAGTGARQLEGVIRATQPPCRPCYRPPESPAVPRNADSPDSELAQGLAPDAT